MQCNASSATQTRIGYAHRWMGDYVGQVVAGRNLLFFPDFELRNLFSLLYLMDGQSQIFKNLLLLTSLTFDI